MSSPCGGSSQARCSVIGIDVKQFLLLSCIPFSLGRTRMSISARQLAVCPQPAASWDKAITQRYCDAERQHTPTQNTPAAALSYDLPGRSFVQPSEGALSGAAWWFYRWSGKRHMMAMEVWHVCLLVLLTFNDDLYCSGYCCWARSRVNPLVHFAVCVQ